jgi:hypothetical protein
VYHSTGVSLRYLSWPWVAGLLSVLSLLVHASLLPQFASAIPSDLGDPILNTWILWWNAQQVPLTEAYWNAPAFAPAPNALALSETLIGLTWLTTPLQWLGASPLTAYNVMFVALPVLNGLGAYWLCLTLTGRRDAAFIGSLAFAFAPYHASQLSHLQIRAMFFMPIALVGLHRYWRDGHRGWLVVLAAATALNGLVSGYLLIYFSVFVALAIAWLMIGAPDVKKLGGVALALLVAAVAVSPVYLTFARVQREWHLGRDINEIERLSADLSSIARGSPTLAWWPVTAPANLVEVAGYPGLVVGGLVIAAAVMAIRDRRRDLASPPWRRYLVRVLAALSAATALVGLVVFLRGDVSYKVFGIGLDLALLAVLCSERLRILVRSGSMAALYASGAAVALIMALGPVARVFGHRFWYKPPFAWFMQLPGFDSTRVPARFAVVEILCLAVVAAFAIKWLWPAATRKSLLATMILAGAIVADGWASVPAVPAPRPLPTSHQADLLVELPTRGWIEDAPAMYRAMGHGRAIVNGYSGYFPPHYIELQRDLRDNCVKSLEAVRGGRSMDAVIWKSDGSAPAIDQGLRELWPAATREETGDVIVYRQPGTPAVIDYPRCDPPSNDR